MARAWASFDYRDVSGTSTADADGSAEIIFGPVDPEHAWKVTRCMVGTQGSSTSSSAYLYVGQVGPRSLRDGTDSGDLDIGEYPAGLLVPASDELTVAWTGVTPGAVVVAAVQYEDLVSFAIPDQNYFLAQGRRGR